ncbi:MAG: hypothetical protein J0G94_03450 [Sphingomonadales bacterium]|nr:hypothetical protein [Sphingomonadales bacterium]
MLKALLRQPAMAFSALAVAALLVHVAAALMIAALPGASLTARLTAGGQVTFDEQAGHPAGAKAVFVDERGRERLVVRMADLLSGLDVRGRPEGPGTTQERYRRISELLREPGLRVRLPDGQMVPASATRGTIRSLDGGAWLALGIGLCATLAGLWVLVLRPREWAARMFMLSGLGLALGVITIAGYERVSLAIDPRTLFWIIQVNYLSAFVFGSAVVALFARYPLPLVPIPWLVLAAVAQGVLWIVGLLAPGPDVFSFQVAVVLSLGLLSLVLAGVQGWLSRRDPALRTAFILIWTSLLLCIGLFSIANLVPQLTGLPPMMSEPVAASGFLLFYLALAVAVARYRLFDLGAWSVNVALSALVLIVVLAGDFGLVLLTDGTWTVSLAFLSAAIIWLPLREILLRRTDRARNRRDILLLRGASEVAFAPRPEQQPELWRRLLDRQFSPLTIEPAACEAATIRADGRILAVPSPLGGPALALGYANRGNRLFNSEDKSLAAALVALVAEMVDARMAYDRGVRSERQRIARDLHDDVGARLMTTLHRGDLETVHADVREAMADMRLIIDGMSDQVRRLSDLVADLRHETVNRLMLAHVTVDWPISAMFDDDRPMEAVQARVLFSVVRELTSNVIRHAGARAVWISSDLSDGGVVLCVRDDGRGFDPDSAMLGNGLRNVRKRIEELGGSMQSNSGPQGSLIGIFLPVASPEQGMADTPVFD